jgi:hypothetical protein
MRARQLTVLAAITLPALAVGQYDPRGTPPPPRRAAPPREAGPGPTGLTLSLRAGYATPGGEIADDVDPVSGAEIYPPLDDVVVRKIPFWIELGYRFTPVVWGGIYLELAPVRGDRSFCLPDRSCEASTVRFGLDLQLHFSPRGSLDPWIGVGGGIEILNAELFDPTANAISEFSWAGFELPLVEAGLDVAVSRQVALGPYVSWSLGQYTSFSVRTPGFADESGRLDDRAFHSWFEVGLRGTLKL